MIPGWVAPSGDSQGVERLDVRLVGRPVVVPEGANAVPEPVRVCRRLVYVSPAVLAGVFWW